MSSGGPEVAVTALGGLGEFGLNSLLLEAAGDAVLIDAGAMFPPPEALGVDVLVPDYTSLAERAGSLRAIVLTHGHEDHVGALAAALRAAPVPVYGTPLTLGLARRRLREAGVSAEMRALTPGQSLSLGALRVHAIRVAHSVLDSLALVVETPAGVIVHSGDFKIDPSAPPEERTDLEALAEWGRRGVLALLSDSTNVERPGCAGGEDEVVPAFEQVFEQARGRVLVSCFATALPRIQRVSAIAARRGRSLAFLGRRMSETLEVAQEVGRLALPAPRLSLGEAAVAPPERVALFVSGSQGEPLSALSSLAAGEYRGLKAGPGDTLVLSARVVPGNERPVSRLISDFYRQGCEVLHPGTARVHVSGHGNRDDLLELLRAVRPRHLIPIHGEYRMLAQHGRLAAQAGLAPEAVTVAETGDVVRLGADGASREGRVATGRVMLDRTATLLEQTVVRERRAVSGAGFVVPVVVLDRATRHLQAEPRIVSRGVLGGAEGEALMAEARRAAARVIEGGTDAERGDAALTRERLRLEMRRLFRRAHRRPLVDPVVVEV